MQLIGRPFLQPHYGQRIQAHLPFLGIGQCVLAFYLADEYGPIGYQFSDQLAAGRTLHARRQCWCLVGFFFAANISAASSKACMVQTSPVTHASTPAAMYPSSLTKQPSINIYKNTTSHILYLTVVILEPMRQSLQTPTTVLPYPALHMLTTSLGSTITLQPSPLPAWRSAPLPQRATSLQ